MDWETVKAVMATPFVLGGSFFWLTSAYERRREDALAGLWLSIGCWLTVILIASL